jgi:hypothetical protein
MRLAFGLITPTWIYQDYDNLRMRSLNLSTGFHWTSAKPLYWSCSIRLLGFGFIVSRESIAPVAPLDERPYEPMEC